MKTKNTLALVLLLAVASLTITPSMAHACYGDLDGDGDVDGTDFGNTHAICGLIGGCDLKFWGGFFNCYTA